MNEERDGSEVKRDGEGFKGPAKGDQRRLGVAF